MPLRSKVPGRVAAVALAGLAWSAALPAGACIEDLHVHLASPAIEGTLAENDDVVLAVYLGDASDVDVMVEVDGEEVDVSLELVSAYTGVGNGRRFYALRFPPDDAPTEGETISLEVGHGGLFQRGFTQTFVVGPPDASPLLADVDHTLHLEFVRDGADSCTYDDQFASYVSFDTLPNQTEGERTRFVELLFFRESEGPGAPVAQALGTPGGYDSTVYASVPATEELSSLCARVAVTDAQGEYAVIHEDCDLCSSFPEACRRGGCSIGGERSLSWALVLLPLAGLGRGRYSNSAPSGSKRR